MNKKSSFTNRFLENLAPTYIKVWMFLFRLVLVLVAIAIVAAIAGTIWSIIF